GSEHDSGNDRGEFVAGGGRRGRYQLCRSLSANHRTLSGQEGKNQVRFSKKPSRPRNRRVSNLRQRRQQHLLDVKVRSRSATQHRNRRILVLVSKFALLVALCAGIYLGAREGAKRFFFDNPDYQLSAIEV